MAKLVIDTNEVHSTNEAAALMGIGYATLYRWIKAGKLISIKVNGRTYIPASEIARVRKMRDAT